MRRVYIWGRIGGGGAYEHDRRESHPFQFDGEFVAGFDCGLVGGLVLDCSNEALGPFGDAGEV